MIRTTVVGSYPVPAWLRAHPSREGVRDALLAVVKIQELAGVEVVSDGELTRFDPAHPDTNGMIDAFVLPLDGVRERLTLDELRAWRARPDLAYRERPAGVVVGPVGPGTLDLESEWRTFRGLTDRARKVTVTSPYMLAKVLADEHYRSVEALTLAIADVLAGQLREIDADVVQVDEANVTGSPDDGAIAAAAINRVLAAAQGEKAVHLCFGNYGGQTVQRGTYEKLVAFLDALDADHVVLEVARRPAPELDALSSVRAGIGVGVGVIDVKDNEIETPDRVAARIERAVEVLGPDRVRYVHPDCGLWMLPRSVADGKLRALVGGRDLFEGRAR